MVSLIYETEDNNHCLKKIGLSLNGNIMHKSLAILMCVQVNNDMNFLSGLETEHSKSELHDRSWRGISSTRLILVTVVSS